VSYTAIRLQSYGSSSEVLKGHADAITASLYTRYRAPTGMMALDRPVRYVLEYAFTCYLRRPAFARLQQPALHRGRPGARLERARHFHHPHPPGQPLPLRHQRLRLRDQPRGELL